MRSRRYHNLMNHELLSKAEEINLIRKAQAGCIQSRDQLILANMKFIYQVCSKYATETVSADDLIADGVLGLIKAIEKFEFQRGTRLLTYAKFWIHSNVRHSKLLEKTICLPKRLKRFRFHVLKAITALESEGYLYPTDAQIAARIKDKDLTPATVNGIRRVLEGAVSFDTPIDATEAGDAILLAETIADTDDPISAADQKMDAAFFLSQLSAEESFVLKHSYDPDKLTTIEISQRIGKHRSTVVRIRKRALAKCQRIADGRDVGNQYSIDLAFFLSQLSAEESFVLKHSYGPDKLTNTEIGQRIGKHHSTVVAIRKRALAKCQRIADGHDVGNQCSMDLAFFHRVAISEEMQDIQSVNANRKSREQD